MQARCAGCHELVQRNGVPASGGLEQGAGAVGIHPARNRSPEANGLPSAVPGVAFLSGGQSDVEATARLDAMHRIGGFPWHLTFSYGRALQAAPLKAWGGMAENVPAAQAAFAHRAKMNGLATLGDWSDGLEQAA